LARFAEPLLRTDPAEFVVAGALNVTGDEIDAGPDGLAYGARGAAVVSGGEHVVERGLFVGVEFLADDGVGGVSLGVGVDDQAPPAAASGLASESEGEGRLADPALLIGDCNDGHVRPPWEKCEESTGCSS